MAWKDLLGVRHFAPETASASAGYVWRDGYVDIHAKEVPTGEIKGAVLGLSDSMAALLGVADPSSIYGPSSAFSAYEQSSAVAIPVNLVAEHFAKVHPTIQNMDTGKMDRKHPILDLLRRPHPLFPRQRFMETIAKYYLIAAECPIVALGRRSKPPLMLQPVNPRHLTPIPDLTTGLPREWQITGTALTGTYKTEPRAMGFEFLDGQDRRLKTVIGFSTRDDALLRGQSKLVSASKEVWQQVEGAKYNLQVLKQGGRASLVFHFKSAMNRPEFLETKQLILKQVEGAQNAGRVLVTRGSDMEIHDISPNNRDMEYQAGQQSMREILAQTYKVPIVLTTTDAATYDNYAQAIVALWDDAVIPLYETLLGAIGDWLMPSFGLEPDTFRIWFDESQIEALAMRELDTRERRMKSGVETINEIRKDIPGAQPMDGGDEILVPGTMVSLSAVAMDPGDVPLPGSPGLPPPPGASGGSPEPDADDDAPQQ